MKENLREDDVFKLLEWLKMTATVWRIRLVVCYERDGGFNFMCLVTKSKREIRESKERKMRLADERQEFTAGIPWNLRINVVIPSYLKFITICLLTRVMSKIPSNISNYTSSRILSQPCSSPSRYFFLLVVIEFLLLWP